MNIALLEVSGASFNLETLEPFAKLKLPYAYGLTILVIPK
jgi:hypothetical protein